MLQHHDRLLGVLLTEGFSAALATHAFSAIDAYVYGFALTWTSLPFEPGDGAGEAFAVKVAAPAELYPHIARSRAELFGDGGYAFADEFDYGLELLLECRVADESPALRERWRIRLRAAGSCSSSDSEKQGTDQVRPLGGTPVPPSGCARGNGPRCG